MLRGSPGRTLVLLAAVAVAPAFASRTHRAPTSGHAHASIAHRAHRAVVRKVNKIRGQREIDPARATEIQAALIRQNYLSGSPTGQWDAETETAMQKFQSDHGWQTKLTPDSRALIKLGLGPNPATSAPTSALSAERTTGTGSTRSSGSRYPGLGSRCHPVSVLKPSFLLQKAGQKPAFCTFRTPFATASCAYNSGPRSSRIVSRRRTSRARLPSTMTSAARGRVL